MPSPSSACSSGHPHQQGRDVIAGESLFNDGISIVLVLFLIAYLEPGSGYLPYSNWWLGFIAETGGAIALGLVMGVVARLLIRSVRQGSVIVLITISAILLIGMIAPSIPVSTPVCAVVAGLVLGRSSVLSQGKGDGGLVIGFWGLVESSLTAMLFLVIGLELLTISFEVETCCGPFVISICSSPDSSPCSFHGWSPVHGRDSNDLRRGLSDDMVRSSWGRLDRDGHVQPS